MYGGHVLHTPLALHTLLAAVGRVAVFGRGVAVLGSFGARTPALGAAGVRRIVVFAVVVQRMRTATRCVSILGVPDRGGIHRAMLLKVGFVRRRCGSCEDRSGGCNLLPRRRGGWPRRGRLGCTAGLGLSRWELLI